VTLAGLRAGRSFYAWLFFSPSFESFQNQDPMKICKNLIFVVVGALTILIYSNCATQITSFVQQTADGYVLTASEKQLKKIRDNSNYAVTFVDFGGQKPDRAVIRKSLSDPSRHSTLEGKATKLGGNRLKITTSSKVTIDLKQPFGTFWGLNSKKIRDFLAGRAEGGEDCGVCYGVKGFTPVTCTDPKSLVCCENCQ
jgi:hypothetical protein